MKNLWIVVVLLACCTLSAQTQKPDFSGTWKLSVLKSSMGSEHNFPNYAYTKIISSTAGSFNLTDIQINASVVNIALPDSKTTSELRLDGTEQDETMPASFPGTPPTKMKVSGEWQGGTLYIQKRGQMFGGAMTLRQRYFLSEDGSQLIELIERRSIAGDKEQRLVFEKN